MTRGADHAAANATAPPHPGDLPPQPRSSTGTPCRPRAPPVPARLAGMNTVAASESPSGKSAPAQSPTGRAPTDRPTAGRVLAGRTSTGRALTGRAPARRAPAASPLDAPQLVPGPDGVREMTTRQLGQAGEELAAERLAAAGWQIVERNLRLRQ